MKAFPPLEILRAMQSQSRAVGRTIYCLGHDPSCDAWGIQGFGGVGDEGTLSGNFFHGVDNNHGFVTSDFGGGAFNPGTATRDQESPTLAAHMHPSATDVTVK